VLAATGREVRTESLRLDRAGVSANQRGVQIDDRCRTSQRHIYAIGDVTGRFQLTHMAEHMAKVAISNCILRLPRKIDERHLTWCTFTSPELAHVGQSERNDSLVLRFSYSKLDRAITDGETQGMVKVICDPRGRILGASILGARAGELIATYAVAMRRRLRVSEVSDTIHAYPTYALANRRAADRWYERHLDSRLLGVLSWLLGYRGVRKGAQAL
jgi:pyruvate/2-oxoglutarate dehydrogenase complex dihydrolipoamide dehydrogenase (E3) component